MKTHPSHRGSALVISLSFLAIITILVVSFASSMRTERAASHAMANSGKAKQVTQTALTHAISLLAKNIPDPGDPTIETPTGSARNWFSNPGRLTIIGPLGPTHIPLHTGVATAADPLTAVNLNAQRVSSGKYPITGSADPMWISWVNVLQDPTRSASDNNEIVSRYAFWIDDESTKINFNVARGKPANVLPGVAGLPSGWATDPYGRDLFNCLTPVFSIGAKEYALGAPASINLDSLGVNVVDLDAEVADRGFLSSPEDIKKFATGDPEAFYESHKFSLTPFSRSPEFNVFGKSRIFMQGSAGDLSKGPMYQHFSSDEQPVQFYGGLSGVKASSGNIDTGKVRELRVPSVRAIAKYLYRSDWPGYESKRFRWVTAPEGREETDQIALNIADMGFWGSTGTGTYPHAQTDSLTTHGGATGAFPAASSPDSFLWKGPLSLKPMLPDYLGPRITELACSVYPVPISGRYTIRVNFTPEFYLPPGGFWAQTASGRVFTNSASGNYRLSSFPTYCTITASDATTTVTNIVTLAYATSNMVRGIPTETPLDGYTFAAGAGMYLHKNNSNLPLPAVSTTNSAKFTPPITVTVKARYALTSTNGGRKPIQLIPGSVPPSEGGDSGTFAATDDEGTLDFSVVVGTDTVSGYTMSRVIGDPRLSTHRSEWVPHTDAADPGSFESLGAPNPTVFQYDDSAASKWGMWAWKEETSHRPGGIGMFSLVSTGMQRRVPADTMRFRQYTRGADEIPDWVMLDLVAPRFSYPVSYMNSTAGRINLNNKIYPDTSAVFNPPERVEPLMALFAHMPNAAAVVQNIGLFQSSGGYFDYIGRIADVPGAADASIGNTDFEKESYLRNLAGLMTTQSNTFGVWGVAQTVKKRANSAHPGTFEQGDFVTGEKRFYAVVERYVWPGRDGVPGNGKADSTGLYAASNNSFPEAPGAAPTKNSWSTTTIPPIWAALDGPQWMSTMPSFMGAFPYNSSPLQTADNPLAAAMKYRVIYFTYLD